MKKKIKTYIKTKDDKVYKTKDIIFTCGGFWINNIKFYSNCDIVSTADKEIDL